MQGDDFDAITNTVNLYPVAVDTLQWSLFDRVFTEDCVVDFGGPAVFEGLEPLKQVFDVIHAPFKATQHFTSNHHIDVTGSGATCLSYVRGVFVRDVTEGGNMFESTGWYDDVLLRTGGGWLISRRVCRMSWWGGNPDVIRTSPEAGPPAETDSLSAEAKAGRLAHLDALLGNS
ncbi:MAG: nuclear transport factor 2 family protein [Novosphingobium sp.]|nr:nuclear transport factor 2 family protein [Novosphingobium sp.]